MGDEPRAKALLTVKLVNGGEQVGVDIGVGAAGVVLMGTGADVDVDVDTDVVGVNGTDDDEVVMLVP
jgi:hypothetical protein